jgi:hypothetical protein
MCTGLEVTSPNHKMLDSTRRLLVVALSILSLLGAPPCFAQTVPVETRTSPVDERPPPVAIPAPSGTQSERGIAASIIKAWLETAPPVEPPRMAQVLDAYAVFEIRAIESELGAQLTNSHDYSEREKLAALVAKLELALQAIAPDRYKLGRPALENKNECLDDPYDDACSDRLDGFAAAAHNLSSGWACWRLLTALKRKGPQFRQGYLDWWHKHANASDKCEQPPRPPRCLIAKCWGGDSGYRFGVAFRPAVQLGATFGDGLGFSDEKADFAGQFSGSLGLRSFFWDDAVDLHLGLGIGTSSAKSAPATEEATGASKTQAFLLFQVGIAAWNGIAGVSYLRTMDPRSGGPDDGHGISLFVDAAAAERIAASLASSP